MQVLTHKKITEINHYTSLFLVDFAKWINSLEIIKCVANECVNFPFVKGTPFIEGFCNWFFILVLFIVIAGCWLLLINEVGIIKLQLIFFYIGKYLFLFYIFHFKNVTAKSYEFLIFL